MAYLYPPAVFVDGDISAADLGVPVEIGAPTSAIYGLSSTGAYSIQLQASGLSFAGVRVPIVTAVAAQGVLARIDGLAWGNTGNSYAGVYVVGTNGKMAVIRQNGQGGWQVLQYNDASFAGEVSVYNQASASDLSIWNAISFDATDAFYETSTDGANFRISRQETLIAFLGGGVVEMGIFHIVGVGIWGGVRFGSAGPR
jgi:hypothetical protein